MVNWQNTNCKIAKLDCFPQSCYHLPSGLEQPLIKEPKMTFYWSYLDGVPSSKWVYLISFSQRLYRMVPPSYKLVYKPH